ncbi:MAG: hypothetical protein JW843_10575, partial [Candidatus Aminicenantes bacterium]|nr:hypothetical protein [Candidatus Aminicenantes bacterium]
MERLRITSKLVQSTRVLKWAAKIDHVRTGEYSEGTSPPRAVRAASVRSYFAQRRRISSSRPVISQRMRDCGMRPLA